MPVTRAQLERGAFENAGALLVLITHGFEQPDHKYGRSKGAQKLGEDEGWDMVGADTRECIGKGARNRIGGIGERCGGCKPVSGCNVQAHGIGNRIGSKSYTPQYCCDQPEGCNELRRPFWQTGPAQRGRLT
jgi:hypothetical protein